METNNHGPLPILHEAGGDNWENGVEILINEPPDTGPGTSSDPCGRTPWVEVVKRGSKLKQSKASAAVQGPTVKGGPPPANRKAALVQKRIPRTSAVVIDRPTGEGASLLSVMQKVTKEVDLKACGIQVTNTRRSRTGGIILVVNDSATATKLAEELRTSIDGRARVRIPARRTPVLLVGVPEWCTSQDVEDGLCGAGLTREDYLREGSSTIALRKNTGGRGDVVARIDVPHAAALKLHWARTVSVGWTRCKVKLLEKKHPTCFRCRKQGHYAVECKGNIDHKAEVVAGPSTESPTGLEGHQGMSTATSHTSDGRQGTRLQDAADRIR